VHIRSASQVNMYATIFKGNKRSALLKAGIMIATIALVDWWVVGEIPLGFLYLAPMLTVGGGSGPVANRCVCGSVHLSGRDLR